MSLDPNSNQNAVSAAASALQAVGIAPTNNPLQQVQQVQHQHQVQLDHASQYAQQQLSQTQFYQQQVEQAQRQQQQQQHQQHQQQQHHQHQVGQHPLLSAAQQQHYAQQLAQSLPQATGSNAQGQLVQPQHSFQPSAPRAEFDSREELVSYIHQYAKDNGFGIVISHSNEKAIYFTCELGGSYRNKRNINDKERKRKLTTRKINCPFSMVANCKKGDQEEGSNWLLRITSNEHNHDKLNLNESFPMLRRRNPEINREIRELYLKGNKPLAIEKILKAKFKEILINREDIYNETRKMKREEKLKNEGGILPQDHHLAQNLSHHQSHDVKDDVFDQNIPNLLQANGIPLSLTDQYVSALQQNQSQQQQQHQQSSEHQQQGSNQSNQGGEHSSQQLQNQINQAQYNLQQVNQAIANAQQNPPQNQQQQQQQDQDTNLSNIDINLVKHQGLMR